MKIYEIKNSLRGKEEKKKRNPGEIHFPPLLHAASYLEQEKKYPPGHVGHMDGICLEVQMDFGGVGPANM